MTEEKKHTLSYEKFIKQPIKIGGKKVDLDEILKNGGEASFKSNKEKKNPDILFSVSDRSVSIKIENNDEFSFKAGMGENTEYTTLHFWVYTKNQLGEKYPGFPHGGQLVYTAFEFLKKKNTISCIQGDWYQGEDNYKSYQKAIGDNKSPGKEVQSQAVNNTWSGRIFDILGYANTDGVISPYGDDVNICANFYPKPRNFLQRFLRRG